MLFEIGAVPSGPPIETKKALLLLDFQNDFASPEGKLPISNVPSFLPSLTSLVADFRAKGEVIWAGTEYKQSRTSISPNTGTHSILLKQFLKNNDPDTETSEYLDNPDNTRSPLEDPLSPSSKPDVTHDREAFLAPTLTSTKYRCCIPGSSGAEYPDLLKVAVDAQQDLVMTKSHYSAFVDTNLLLHLRTRLVTELFVCGSLSNISVYATVLDAVCHGLKVTIVEDCLGYNDEMCHIEAVRQMADHMGASGVDCQELRDDLAGLLGDIIREEDYTTKFQVSLPPPARRTRSHTSRKQIQDWITALENEEAALIAVEDEGQGDGILWSRIDGTATSGRTSFTSRESSRKPGQSTSILERSPPRKRSPSDLDPLEEDRAAKLPHKPSSRRTSNTYAETSKQKQTKSTVRKRRPSHEASVRSFTPTAQAPLTQTPSMGNFSAQKEISLGIDHIQQNQEPIPEQLNPDAHQMAPKKKKKLTPNVLGPESKIGQGDSQLCLDVLSRDEADKAFSACRNAIKWQKMFHRSGEVPRLVAVQGIISEDLAEMPIYRHPADESPELLPFDPIVDQLRLAAEKKVGHPLNHVLIQWYRNGEDNISEHSDKTLDIVRGSSIVNLSLGAQRTMTLRTKRSSSTSACPHEVAEADNSRSSQRILLPHNSLFILGQETNKQWLHAIRADKRPPSEKSPAELAFEGERISLTFRHIGTFIHPKNNTIWGQGATSKTRQGARKLLGGDEAEIQGEAMIRAFGQENHRSTDWDWDSWYGQGFDVVNFETKKT